MSRVEKFPKINKRASPFIRKGRVILIDYKIRDLRVPNSQEKWLILLKLGQYTLTFLINGEARLLILGNFSTLDTLIRASPFIYFWKIFLPPRLLGTLKTQNNIYI